MAKNNLITVFEHDSLTIGEKNFTSSQFEALKKFYGSGGKDKPYFLLINNGVKFNEYVGVIQIGDTLIEVLPKADKNNGDDSHWRDILIGMMSAVNMFDIHAPSSSQLKIKPNSILDLYFGLFIQEVEYLLHTGLVKQYRNKESNLTALKGRLLFNKHIQQNLLHKERFYVSYTTYDVEHTMHFIIYKTIKLLNQINTSADLKSKVGSLLLYFPEMPDIKVSEVLFNKITFNRKTLPYERAISIAKLILLQYHPDISSGLNNVLALMFDMNLLWEKFVYHSLMRNLESGWTVTKQSSKNFWRPADSRTSSKIRPDIVIQAKDNDVCVVLDTKWKNLNGNNPSPDDLRQMYVYHHYYDAKKVALVYPGVSASYIPGNYHRSVDGQNGHLDDKECGVLTLAVKKMGEEIDNGKKWTIGLWQKEITAKVRESLVGT
jgi:5-methylcytosine-specific restriction enzyme subunit McrC